MRIYYDKMIHCIDWRNEDISLAESGFRVRMEEILVGI